MLPVAPAAAPAPAPVADSSVPCFNEADFREGTTLEFEAVKPGAGPAAIPFKRKSVTEGREAFGGSNPIAFNVGSEVINYPNFESRTTRKEYKDLSNGNIFLYGKATIYSSKVDPKGLATLPAGFPATQSSSDATVYSPPFSFPVDMTPGQTVSQRTSVSKSHVADGSSGTATSSPAKAELVYYGREKLETPLGSFDTCKLSLKITVSSSGITKDMTNEFWLAAEGPYRGQMLKGLDPKSPMLATKMTYSPK